MSDLLHYNGYVGALGKFNTSHVNLLANPENYNRYNTVDYMSHSGLSRLPRAVDTDYVTSDNHNQTQGISGYVEGYVERWCIHTRQDSGGDRLLSMMKSYSLL